MACGLTNAGPIMRNRATGYGKVECVMYGESLGDQEVALGRPHRLGDPSTAIPGTRRWHSPNLAP